MSRPAPLQVDPVVPDDGGAGAGIPVAHACPATLPASPGGFDPARAHDSPPDAPRTRIEILPWEGIPLSGQSVLIQEGPPPRDAPGPSLYAVPVVTVAAPAPAPPAGRFRPPVVPQPATPATTPAVVSAGAGRDPALLTLAKVSAAELPPAGPTPSGESERPASALVPKAAAVLIPGQSAAVGQVVPGAGSGPGHPAASLPKPASPLGGADLADVLAAAGLSLPATPGDPAAGRRAEAVSIAKVLQSTPVDFRESLEQSAKAWMRAGQPAAFLLRDLALVRARLWSWSTGGKARPLSPVLHEFIESSHAALGEGWWSDQFCGRSHCSHCGERFAVENLSFCTTCTRLTCYMCYRLFGLHPDGNQLCSCGGELVG